MLIKNNKQIIFQIDDYYTNNFSYLNIERTIKRLKNKFREIDILYYFLTKSSNESKNFAKYTFPLIFLSKELLEEESDKIINNISSEDINKIQYFMNCDYLFESYLYKILSECLNEDLKIINDTLENKHKLLDKYRNMGKVQLGLQKLYIKLVTSNENKEKYEIESSLYSIIKYSKDCLQIDSWQNILYKLIINPQTNSELIQSIPFDELNNITTIKVIQYLNAKQNLENKDIYVFDKMKRSIKKCKEQEVDLKKIIDIYKNNGIFFEIFKITYDIWEDIDLTKDYCQFIWKSFKENLNIVEFGKGVIGDDYKVNTLTRFISLIIHLNITNIIEEIWNYIENNEFMLLNTAEKSENKSEFIIYTFWTEDIVPLLIEKANNDDSFYNYLKSLYHRSTNEKFVYRIEKSIINLNNKELLLDKIDELRRNIYVEDKEVKFIHKFIYSIDIEKNIGIIEALLLINNKGLNDQCHRVINRYLENKYKNTAL